MQKKAIALGLTSTIAIGSGQIAVFANESTNNTLVEVATAEQFINAIKDSNINKIVIKEI